MPSVASERGRATRVAHATTLAGSVTLIGTSSNMLIAGIANPLGVNLSMFSFLPVAVPVALAGVGGAATDRAPAAPRGTAGLGERTRLAGRAPAVRRRQQRRPHRR